MLNVEVRQRATVLSVALGCIGISALTLGVTQTPPAFPLDVQQALDVAVKKTRVPVLAPAWIPDRTAANSRLSPAHGTFAVSLQAFRTAYAISWYYEPHGLAVNNPEIAQDSTDPQHAPMLTVEGSRYSTRAQARAVVWSNIFYPKTHDVIPVHARAVAIASTVTGWVWSTKDTDDIVWQERGWTLATSAPMPSLREKSLWATQATTWARTLLPKIMAPMPGQVGTIRVNPTGGVWIKWQRGRIVYAVYEPYGLSPATTVVGALYPYAVLPHRS
jgi:hypothetical protein